MTKSYSKTVPNLELFPYLGKKSNESVITPACSNTTKEFSSKLMGWKDLLKAIKYKKNLTIGKSSRGIDGDRRVLWKAGQVSYSNPESWSFYIQ